MTSSTNSSSVLRCLRGVTPLRQVSFDEALSVAQPEPVKPDETAGLSGALYERFS